LPGDHARRRAQKDLVRIMDLNEYQAQAARTSNRFLGMREKIIGYALGLSGESGEVADRVKKFVAQGHDLDFEKIRDELGDVLWYVAELARAIGYSLSDVAESNVSKLRARYPEGFSEERSQFRQG
jgi:NTP pyrophosphatase (non-canonical NTP hydrolase)